MVLFDSHQIYFLFYSNCKILDLDYDYLQMNFICNQKLTFEEKLSE